MRRATLGIVLVLVLCGELFGNVGLFLGSGHSLQLVKSTDIQLVSEDVTITPVCGVSKEMHSVKYRCTFVLKNQSAKSVKIQVGFPLDRAPRLIKGDDTDLVLSTHFIVRDTDHTYHVRHVADSPQNKYKHIFLWDMEFAPLETKTLHVGYVLPMSFAAFTTRRTEHEEQLQFPPKQEKPWHSRVEACIVVFFSYITETGKTWVGPIEKATFRVENTIFEHSLRKIPEYMGGNPADFSPSIEIPDEDPADASAGSMAGFVFGLKLGNVYPLISPEGWKTAYFPEIPPSETKPQYEPDVIVWQFENYKPGPPLKFTYYLVGFPETVADCDPWVRRVLGKTPKKEDVVDLREIVAAFFGVSPKSPAVKRFVEQQIWYNPHSKVTESELTERQRAVLTCLWTTAKDQTTN